jgi:hypothetical protein
MRSTAHQAHLPVLTNVSPSPLGAWSTLNSGIWYHYTPGMAPGQCRPTPGERPRFGARFPSTPTPSPPRPARGRRGIWMVGFLGGGAAQKAHKKCGLPALGCRATAFVDPGKRQYNSHDPWGKSILGASPACGQCRPFRYPYARPQGPDTVFSGGWWAAWPPPTPSWPYP